jgi:uncharacterized membrane protein
MKLKILLGVLVFLIVLNLATIGTFLYLHFTRPAPPPFLATEMEPESAGPMRPPRLRHFPPEQRKELVGLLEEFRNETSALRLRAMDLEGEAFDLMQKDPFPAARVDSLLREISATRLEISRTAVRKLVKAKTILPPEEQRIFFDAILQARPSHGPLHGPGRGERRFDGRGRRVRPDSL